MKVKVLQALVAVLVCAGAQAQVNSGSDGHDGAFNPTSNTVINMADHPDGIYHYTEVNIPAGVTVSFIPNAANTPVVWLVLSNCVIGGSVVLDGSAGVEPTGGSGGPGGYSGGLGPLSNQTLPGAGAGPGGGQVTSGSTDLLGANASYGTLGGTNGCGPRYPVGSLYGNGWLVPLLGGSGGSGGYANYSTYPYGGLVIKRSGGGGGGGAILIAVSQSVIVTGTINANGGSATAGGGGGSGGAIRLIAPVVAGNGSLQAAGGFPGPSCLWDSALSAGMGRVRIDSLADQFAGSISGATSRGYQPVIIPPTNQAVSLAIHSIAEIAVPHSPTGTSLTPDVVVPGAQQNPVSIVVRCVNIPLNTDIIVDVKPANGSTIRTVGVNNTGTQASSTATVSVTMPRGAGTIQAKCVSGIAGTLGASLNQGEKFKHYAQTGLTADGEVFAKMEITATLGGGQEIAYLTESGKRYSLPSR